MAQQTPPAAVKTDGRKRRWHQHKVERRNELVDGTLEAIRRRGSNVSMDEIAAEIGVSKTVLYRYFVDKNDLTTAVMMRFAQTTLIPNMAAALSSNLDGYDLTREIIRVYVETVAAEPEPYQFVMANNSASKSKAIADSEQIIARMLAVMLRRRMVEVGMDTGGVEPWAYHTVGGVQLATHSWMSNPRMSADELIDYLTMLSWNALCGIVEVGGSLEKFREVPHPSPILPPRLLDDDDQLDPTCRRLWTHEPHVHLVFRAGRQGRRHRHRTRPRGFEGNKSDAPTLQDERNDPLRRTAGDALRQQQIAATRVRCCWCCRAWTPRARAASSNTLSEPANPQGIRYTSFGKPTEEELAHHYLWRIRNALPPAGHIGVFDRSHYEDVLIVRVHNLVPPEVWGTRYDEINAFEKELVDGGTTLVKVAMFVSLDEQKKRLAERLDRPDKYWKYNPADIDERQTVAEVLRRPIRRCWTGRRRTTRRGTSCRATGSGTAGWRSPNCSSRR